MLKFLRYFLAFVGAALFILLANMAGADSAPSWLESNELNLQKQAEVSTLPVAVNGNIDCYQSDINTCAIPTQYGSATFNSSAALHGSSVFHPVISYIDNHQRFLPVPNSSTVITYTTNPTYGFYLYFNYDLAGSISAINQGSGPEYKINQPPDGELADASGHLLPADYTSMSFSQNGQWMVVSDPNVAMLRVNLQTFQVTPFAQGFNYTEGLAPDLRTAISDDGRYAVVSSKNFNVLTIYDLSTCEPTPGNITGPVDCQSRDLSLLLHQQIDGYINSSNIRFIDDDVLSLYATYGSGVASVTAKFLLSDSGSNINQLEYLALGDSYISGEGAFDYQAGTDTDDNHCHISQVAYPYLLGHDLNFDSYHSVACSGALTNDITDTDDNYSGQVRNKLPRSKREVPSIINNFQPGYIDQLDFVSNYQPKIITVSIGGNDIGFSAKLRSCLGISTCYNNYEDRLEFVREVNGKFDALVNTYTQIKNADAPDALIYVIGYPQIAKAGGDCADNVHMNNDELIFAQQAISYLDTVVQAAAAKAGVDYVDTQNALDGHRLCEAGPGSIAMNGITAGHDAPAFLSGPFGNESYHPNAFGHELLENTVLSKTHNLTDPMPAADLTASEPSETGLDILNVPSDGRDVKTTEYDPTISGDVLFKQSLNSMSVKGVDHSLAANTSLQVEVHSFPVSLGTFATDDTGNLSVQIAIPDSVPAGYHTLHLYGNDLNDQPIDIYKVVYIAGSPDDLDGDGIPDSGEACVGVPASGRDLDQDGIDDSCDGTVALPPAQIKDAAEVDSIQRSNPSTSSSKVLGAQSAKKLATAAPNELTAMASVQKPNAKVMAAAGGVCVWIVLCYAAYKLRI